MVGAERFRNNKFKWRLPKSKKFIKPRKPKKAKKHGAR